MRLSNLLDYGDLLCKISNTRKRVSSDIQTLRSRFKNRGVWISDETHFPVFDMASQMINNSWRNSKLKLGKFYGNWKHISKPRSQ